MDARTEPLLSLGANFDALGTHRHSNGDASESFRGNPVVPRASDFV